MLAIIKEQDIVTQKIGTVIDRYTQLFQNLGERQHQIENELTQHGDTFLALNEKIGQIMTHFFKTETLNQNAYLTPPLPTIEPNKPPRTPPTTAVAEGGMSL